MLSDIASLTGIFLFMNMVFIIKHPYIRMISNIMQ